MKIKIFQKGFNYSQDGEGNRLVYHLQGCNMHCPWCANPEGISIEGTLEVNNDLLLDSVCPYGAIANKSLERSLCEKCNTRECITYNKNMGIRLSCEEFDIETILAEIKRSSSLFYDGGGVTFTGGEPTLQYDVLKTLLMQLKELNINTAIETNGSYPKLEMLFPFIDILIMDFKHYNNGINEKVTGVNNQIIRDNIEKALAFHKRVHIRIPLIKGFNDSEEDTMNFAAFFKEHYSPNASFECLPYHEYGKIKWMQCGMTYVMKDAFVNDKTIALYEDIFKKNNLLIINT